MTDDDEAGFVPLPDEMAGEEMWLCVRTMHSTARLLAKRLGTDDAAVRQMMRNRRRIHRNLTLWLRLHRAFNEAFARPVPWGEKHWRELTAEELAKQAEMRALLAVLEASPRLPNWPPPPAVTEDEAAAS